MAASTKITAFWDIVKCGLVDFITLMKEAVSTSETMVYFNKTTWCYIPEGCHLHVTLGF
jgi:hypothetical protein